MTSTVDHIDDRPPARIRWYAVVSLVGHLLLLGTGAFALWRISGGGWLGAIVALVFAVAYFTMWRVWLAPGSHRRLGTRERFTLTIILVPVVIVLTALAQVWMPALVAGSFILLGDALNDRS